MEASRSDSNEENLEASKAAAQINLNDSKWIDIYVNGDEHFAGMRCVINNKYLRTFGSFLTHITQRLQPSFGAVRNVYSPIQGSRITSLDQLQPNHGYVAAGNDRFKKVENGYSQIRNKGKKLVRKPPSLKVKPTNRQVRKITTGRLSKLAGDVLTIHVYRNGDDVTPPAKFVFSKRELLHWEGIMGAIGDKVQLKSGFVKRLCNLAGETIEGVDDLSNRKSYVAVGRSEHFKPKHYREVVPNSTVPAQRIVRRRQSQIFSARRTETGVNTSHTSHTTPIINPSNQHMKVEDHEITENQENLKQDFTSHSLEKYMLESEEGVFKVLQQKMLEPVEEINLDEDHGGIFRASEQSDITTGANEIEDTLDTAVELPIDEIEAEEIEDSITPEMERAMQDLDLNSSQIVAYLPSLSNKTSVTPTKQILRATTGIQSQYQNTFA